MTDKDLSSYLDLDPYTFDQSEKGWRRLDKAGKPEEAIKLIEQYLQKNQSRLREDVLAVDLERVIHFHLGQLYANLGEKHYESALRAFRKSERPDREGWNYYLEATVAYLERDEQKLLKNLKLLQDLEEHLGVGIWNLDIVETFLKQLREGQFSYREAFAVARREAMQ